MMFHTFRKYKFCTFTVVSQDSQRFAICQYSVSQGFAKKEICKVSQIGFSFRKVCKVFAMGIGHVQGCQSRCTPGARASDSRPCRRRLWPSALLTLRLRVEAGQHPRTPPHRPRRSLRRPRPPCSLRPHCPFYPFSSLVSSRRDARTKPSESSCARRRVIPCLSQVSSDGQKIYQV